MDVVCVSYLVDKLLYRLDILVTHCQNAPLLSFFSTFSTFCFIILTVPPQGNFRLVKDSINAMVVRCKLALMQYDFDFEHIAGVLNIVADYLSRLVQNHMLNNKLYKQQLSPISWFYGVHYS
jgi:hypothetical protein